MTTTETTQPGLFAQLEPLLAHRAVLITVSKLEGDQLLVKVISIDGNKIRLSRKAVLRDQRAKAATQHEPQGPK